MGPRHLRSRQICRTALDQQFEYRSAMSLDKLFVAVLIGASLLSMVLLAGVLLWR